MWKRCWRLLGSTNRYTDGTGRRLDTSELPSDLYLEPISNRAYPVRGEHWQPVVAGEPSPHKGNVIISGAGVVGVSVAALFALRGWHVTVVERDASVLELPQCPVESLAPPGVMAAEAKKESRSRWGPFLGLQHALLTRRAVDVLEAIGIHVRDLKRCGVPVSGIMDHPGAYNTWLTRGLTEHHPFALKMLSVDLLALRQVLERHIHALPTDNCRLFHEHVVEMVYPLKQQLVVKPISESRVYAGLAKGFSAGDGSRSSNSGAGGGGGGGGGEDTLVETPRGCMETSLTLHRIKWEKKYASEAVNYDLLVCADGVNSHLRDLLDVEGFAADTDFAVRWFHLRSGRLSHAHVHRWLHMRREKPVELHDVRSPCQVPLAIAFPQMAHDERDDHHGDEKDEDRCRGFALMVYAPASDIGQLSDQEALRTFCPDIAENDSTCRIVSFTRNFTPYPTIHCENLFNSVGLPSAVVVGDAAHACNPFWLQGLALGLEDGVNLLNQVDAYSKHFYDAVRQYSQERGCSGDALREITDRCLHYERMKHINPFVRLQNTYQLAMNIIFPRVLNDYYSGASVNHVYSKSLEFMLNGRGYTSYEYAEKQQAKHQAFFHLGRVYT